MYPENYNNKEKRKLNFQSNKRNQVSFKMKRKNNPQTTIYILLYVINFQRGRSTFLQNIPTAKLGKPGKIV